MVAATLEDAVLVEKRPNLPGTTSAQRPNWSQALPLPLERLVTDSGVGRLVDVLAWRRSDATRDEGSGRPAAGG
jgi:4-alpha-glucanotransferase